MRLGDGRGLVSSFLFQWWASTLCGGIVQDLLAEDLVGAEHTPSARRLFGVLRSWVLVGSVRTIHTIFQEVPVRSIRG